MHTNDQQKTARDENVPLIPSASAAANASTLSTPASQAKRQLIAFLTNHTTELLGIMRSYVLRMGLAQGQAVPDVALDVFQEVAVEALNHIDRFRPDGQPMAWLLGIAVNVIRRKKVATAKQYQREVAFGRLALMLQEPCSEDELIDLIAPFTLPDPDHDVEANEQAGLILSLVSHDDQQVLRLAILHDFEREALARELGISPVAARVRLHRALARLRFAWNELQRRQQQQQQQQASVADALERKHR
jgi:RNA polymerase sigma factor (sigma-70 family)